MQLSKPTQSVLRWAAGLVVSVLLPSVSSAQVAAAPPEPSSQKPNIIMIVADDLGYGELSCQGGKTVYTPNIDSIARNGVRFTDGYVSCPVCSPSRAGIMTGRYQTRFGHEFNANLQQTSVTFGLPQGVATLPRRMKEAGYATVLYGKWHLGEQQGYRPIDRGFDRFWGFYLGGHSYRGTTPANPIIDGFTPQKEQPDYITDAISHRAAGYIRVNQHRPFFMMVTYNAVHLPVNTDPAREPRFAYLPDARSRAVRTMLAGMDDGVGEILLTLRATNLLDNTLVIFVSDNGNTPASQIEDNGGFRDGKASLHEGGIRIPMMMQWPKSLPAGQTYTKPVISLDLTATTMAAGGVDLSTRTELDGKDLRPYLTGQKVDDPHEALFWRFGQQRAVRMGNYKLVQTADPGETCLYDLAADPAETTSIASAQPALLQKLETAYQGWNAHNVEPLWKRQSRTGATQPAEGDDEVAPTPEAAPVAAAH